MSYQIKLSKTGRELTWSKGSGKLLDLLEDSGLNPDHSCRVGTCGTCETGITSGNFEYDPEPFIEPSDGRILICCARPLSDMELEL